MPQIEIKQTWVDTYEANIRFALQQNDSKLSDKVTFGTVEGEKKRFTFIGTAAMTERTTKYGKTEFQDISFYNRWIGRRVFDTAFIIDPFEDVEKALTDPTSAIVQSCIKAAKRQKDLVILEAFGGTAWTGTNADQAVPFPEKQILDVQLGGASANAPLCMAKLHELKALRDESEIGDDTWYLAVSPRQMQKLLEDEKASSADYNSFQALVNGTISHYMGFEFVILNNLPIENNVRTCWCWAKSAMQLGVCRDIYVEGPVKDATRNFAPVGQVTMALDAVRLYDEGVFQVPCAE